MIWSMPHIIISIINYKTRVLKVKIFIADRRKYPTKTRPVNKICLIKDSEKYSFQVEKSYSDVGDTTSVANTLCRLSTRFKNWVTENSTFLTFSVFSNILSGLWIEF